ncbi:MAG: hypothetical protein WDM96_17700 [Lacunisphaera sp.]
MRDDLQLQVAAVELQEFGNQPLILHDDHASDERNTALFVAWD